MTTDTKQLINELRILLKCPVDWESIIRNSAGADEKDTLSYAEPVIDNLQCYWCQLTEKFAIEDEWELTKCFNVNLGDGFDTSFSQIDWTDVPYPQFPLAWEDGGDHDPISLGGKLVYVKEWIDTAVSEYCESTSKLAAMQVYDPRGKHVSHGDSDEQVIEKATRNSSLFFPRFYPGLPKLFWYLMRSAWIDVLQGQHIYRAVDCNFAIGATDHHETSCLVFDIQPPNAHAYPVPRVVAHRDYEWEMLDDPPSIFGHQDFKWM